MLTIIYEFPRGVVPILRSGNGNKPKFQGQKVTTKCWVRDCQGEQISRKALSQSHPHF